jgi:twitching motility protein PilI
MSQSNPDLLPDRSLRKPDSGARRLRLREFQAQLVERMQAARSGTDTQVRQLGVMIGGDRWLLNLREAGEIVAVGSITDVPLTQPWFLGLANVRGNLISVIDLARFQGQASTVIDKESRIVAFGPALAFNSALLVSRVMGLRNIAEMTAQPANTDSPAWLPCSYADRDGQLWRQLDLTAMIEDVQFLQVGS